MAVLHPAPEGERPTTASGARGDAHALLAVLRCGKGKGLAAVSIVDPSGNAGGERFIPFGLHEAPSVRGRDYGYAGLCAALDALREQNVRRVLIQTDDQQLVAELEKKVEPHRDLTLLYIMAGCKLNEFHSAKVVAVPRSRVAQLRAKAEGFASMVTRTPRRRRVPLPLAG